VVPDQTAGQEMMAGLEHSCESTHETWHQKIPDQYDAKNVDFAGQFKIRIAQFERRITVEIRISKVEMITGSFAAWQVTIFYTIYVLQTSIYTKALPCTLQHVFFRTGKPDS